MEIVLDEELRARIRRIAEADDRPVSRTVRFLLKKAVELRERELGLRPLEEEGVSQYGRPAAGR